MMEEDKHFDVSMKLRPMMKVLSNIPSSSASNNLYTMVENPSGKPKNI